MSVHTERSGPVTTIIMERPNVRNAVDPATADALVAEFEAFNRDPQAKVAVFFGSHGTFCAGWDLKYGASLAGKDARRELNLDFPQGAVRADRQSAYRQHGLSVRAAMEQEWANGASALAEAIRGAGRFASGKGRHGAFDDI